MDTGTSSPQVKLIAFHLPQFHTLLAHHRWWKKRSAEWANINPKKAVKLCPNARLEVLFT